MFALNNSRSKFADNSEDKLLAMINTMIYEGDENYMAGIGLKRFKYAKLNDDGKTYGQVKTLSGAKWGKISR